jgi:tripeptide aminopeptidase
VFKKLSAIDKKVRNIMELKKNNMRTIPKGIFMSLINRERLLSDFIEILKIKSPSKNEMEIGSYVMKRLEKLGLKSKMDDTGNKIGGNAGNITGFLASNDKSKKTPIFFGAHLDTVPLNGEILPEIKNGKLFNADKNCILGADDKVAIAAILEALEVIKENNIKTCNIYVIFTVGEEIAILGAKNLDLKEIKAKIGFVFDGEGDIGTIFNEAPYHDTIEVTITGKAVHAGIEPERGINSIKVASEAIANLKIGRIDSDSTCNIGIIKGGTATNIIPEITYVKAEARSLNPEKLDRITDDIKTGFLQSAEKYGAKLKIKVEREYNGFKFESDAVPIVMASKALRNMGIEPAISSTGGGSDVNIYNAKGKISVDISSGMEKVHSCNEYVKVAELEKLAGLILEICTLTDA